MNTRLPASRHIGEKFGRWTVYGMAEYRGNQNHFWCRCECGRERKIPASNLYCGKSTQCHACASRRRAERVAKAKGRKIVGKIPGRTNNTYACIKCGAMVRGQHNHCWGCGQAKKAETLRAAPSKKYPEKLRVVGDRYGVTHEWVRQLANEKGWDGMVKHLESRVA